MGKAGEDGENGSSLITQLASSLIPTACFDREINIRRAASAAIQEQVGRQGTFTHGISLVTLADYWSVSSRRRAYLTVSDNVAELYKDYRKYLADHLMQFKLKHQDAAVRELAAEALGRLCKEEEENSSAGETSSPANSEKFTSYVNTSLIPDLIGRIVIATNTTAASKTGGSLFLKPKTISVTEKHGSLLALSELVGQNRMIFTNEAMQSIRNVVPNGEKQRMYRGRGGEILRLAAMRLLKAICRNGKFVRNK
jgi:tubulin-specific chaperone D